MSSANCGNAVTTTKTLNTTLLSRKFSDYQYLCFELLVNDTSVRDTIIVPVNRFVAHNYTIELSYVDSANTQRWVDVFYASDTTFYLVGSSNIVSNTKVHITGMLAHVNTN